MSPMPGIFRELLGDAVVHQAGDRETLPILQIHFGFDAARRKSGNHEALESESIREIERADFRLDLQMNQAVRRSASG